MQSLCKELQKTSNLQWAISCARSTKPRKFTSSCIPSPVVPQKGSTHRYNVTEHSCHINQSKAVLPSKSSMGKLAKAKHDVPAADPTGSRCEITKTAVIAIPHLVGLSQPINASEFYQSKMAIKKENEHCIKNGCYIEWKLHYKA